MSIDKMVKKVDRMFEHSPSDVEEAKKFIKQIEGTDAFWHMIGTMIVNGTRHERRINDLEQKVQELEQINENMRDSFRRKNEYGY